MQGGKRIALRITLLAWLISLLTLAVFVTAIIPQQKSDLQEALRSKARGVAVSLEGITASAAVSEDYSTIVDQALLVLAGDEAIDYLVVTRNDGYSLIAERNTWRSGQLDRFWHPEAREPIGAIRTAPLFQRRVYAYSQPFSYSGIEWGWLHVGLSLGAYDRSVLQIYERTGLLAIICVMLSAVPSLFFAWHLVAPIRSLQTVVEEVAHGNLQARADIRSGDEVGHLAGAFNSMADTILNRNQILESVGYAAKELLSASDWTLVIEDVMGKISKAGGVTRSYVFQNAFENGALLSRERYEWIAAGIHSVLPRWQSFEWSSEFLDSYREQLSKGQEVTFHVAKLAGPIRGFVYPETKAVVIIPITVRGAWWGFIGFDDCLREREWSAAEKDGFRAAADMLGAAIGKQRAREALIEAKAGLEQRVQARTRELQEEILEKDHAHMELAEAQQRLMELSRLSGMAEVATGVLHNVGNVLNSVNVSASLVADHVRASRVENLASVIGLLRDHEADLGAFLDRDPKGRRLVPYLDNLARHLSQERLSMLDELGQLTHHVGHIKEIVAMQQNYARMSGMIEKVIVEVLVEDALRMMQAGLDKDRVRLYREYEDLPPVSTDKHKFLQIVLNLLKNARDAVREKDQRQREIRIRLQRSGEASFRVQICDNGIGVPPEHLDRIFSHGFTTKEGGHGFGLHTGALAARELGGSLTVASEGPGCGATFTLDLPLQPAGSLERRATA